VRSDAELEGIAREVERQALPITVALLFWLFRNPERTS
jgi:hypothetical protein